MEYQEILYEVDEPVATITLNRPDKLNAWTARMAREIRHAFAAAENDPQVVGMVLTGAGRAFCAGADMEGLQTITTGAKRNAFDSEPSITPGDPRMDPAFRKTYSYIASLRKPLIGAINGPCAGLGLCVALYCDIRFAASSALFVTAFVQRGLVAEHGISWILPRLVGTANAMDLLLSGCRVQADEAEKIGLINRTMPGAELLSYAQIYVRELAAKCSPTSMAIMKRQVYEHLQASLGHAYDHSDTLMAESFARPDMKEGIESYVERRAPNFSRIPS